MSIFLLVSSVDFLDDQDAPLTAPKLLRVVIMHTYVCIAIGNRS